jgi:hypothetical protein
VASAFAAEEWRLLVKLPADVMVATVSIEDDGPRQTVAEGLAGLDAIAAGRGWDSDLVRAVVAAIYAEPEEDRAQEPTGPDDPAARRARVLADCRRAVETLRAGADPADAAAYRHWVQQVAVRVCAASHSGDVLGVGAGSGGPDGGRVRPAEREFLDQLAAVLA